MTLNSRTQWLAGLLLFLVGCGVPTDAEVGDAKDQVIHAIDVAAVFQPVLQLLGLLPSPECGAAERDQVLAAAEKLKARFACAEVTTQPVDDVSDAIVIAFPSEGCDVAGAYVEGQITVTYSGGDDRVTSSMDFRELKVSGQVIPVVLGYDSCGDDAHYSVKAESSISDDGHFTLDLRVSQSDDVLTLDGTVAISQPKGVDQIVFNSLSYEVGELLPNSGEVQLALASGQSIDATLEPGSGLLDITRVKIAIDGSSSVTVPLP